MMDLIVLLLGICLILVCVYIAFIPWKIAVRRSHPKSDAIKILCFFSVFFPVVLWVIAMVWAFSDGKDAAQAIPANASGTFRAIGVMKSTGQDASILVEAGSEANAKVKAELQGMIVTEMRYEPRKQTRAFPVVQPAKPQKPNAVIPAKRPEGYTGAKSLNFPD